MEEEGESRRRAGVPLGGNGCEQSGVFASDLSVLL